MGQQLGAAGRSGEGRGCPRTKDKPRSLSAAEEFGRGEFHVRLIGIIYADTNLRKLKRARTAVSRPLFNLYRDVSYNLFQYGQVAPDVR